MVIRNSVKAPYKISRELQSDLAVSGVKIDPSTVRKRLLTAGKITRKPSKKQLLTPVMMKNDFSGPKTIRIGVQNRDQPTYQPGRYIG